MRGEDIIACGGEEKRREGVEERRKERDVDVFYRRE